MFKKLFILFMLCSSLFSEDIRELTDENFPKATARNIVVVEFWAPWNEANKVTLLEEWENFDVILGDKMNLDHVKWIKVFKYGKIAFLRNPRSIFKKGRTIRFHFDMFHGNGVLDKAINLLNEEDKNDFKKLQDKQCLSKDLYKNGLDVNLVTYPKDNISTGVPDWREKLSSIKSEFGKEDISLFYSGPKKYSKKIKMGCIKEKIAFNEQ